MNRRKLLAISGVGLTSIAGCYGISQTLSSDESDEDSEESSNQPEEDPDFGPDQDNTTETDTEQDENESQSQDTENTSEPDEAEDQNVTDTPDGSPTDAVSIVEHEMVFEEATDPNYDTDELYIQATIRNTSDHDLQNVRLDGYAYAGDTPVGHEHLEYADLEAGGERNPEILFYVDEPAAVGRYRLEVTAAQWA